jgi:PPM family protein phosphatase
MEIGRACNVGMVRKLNEDSILCFSYAGRFNSESPVLGLFAVADGMGGHDAGEIASEWGLKKFAGDTFSGLLEPIAENKKSEEETGSLDAMQEMLASSVKAANKRLFEMTHENESLKGMGTTLCSALIIGENLYVAHVGDSRCYIISSRETLQVSKDHSQVQEMVDAGLITAQEARVHPKKNVITRVVGYYEDTDVDTYHKTLYEGDNILLCSDGLWGVLPDLKITQTVLTAETSQQACDELVNLANEAGGPDNISVIIVRPTGLPVWKEMITANTQMRKIEKPGTAPDQPPAIPPNRPFLSSLFKRKSSGPS